MKHDKHGRHTSWAQVLMGMFEERLPLEHDNHESRTSWVYDLMGMLKERPSPRSAIFKHMASSSTSRFWGFRSRCITPCLWQCAVPLISWYMKLCGAATACRL